MQTNAMSLTVWFAQILTLCALHENLLTTQELDVATTTTEKLTTNQDVRTKTATVAEMTTTGSADELLSDLTPPLTPTLELSGFTSLEEDNRRITTISSSHHNIMSPTETSVSTNNTSVVTDYQETGSGNKSTSINIQEITEISTPGTSIQLDHDVQTTTSTSWTGNGTTDTDDTNTTTVPLIYSTYETDVTLTNGSYGTTDHQSPAPTTAGTYLEILSTNQTLSDDTTNTDTPTGTSGHINITATPVQSTQLTSVSTENTEEPVVSSTKMMDWNIDITATPVQSTQVASDTTENTEEPVVSSTKMMDWSIDITATPVHSTQFTSVSTENTEEPMVSSTKMMYWNTEENAKALATTLGNIYQNMTNTTWRDVSWSTNTEDTWSTNSTTSKNISTSETETPHWTNCFNEDSPSQPRRFSKLVCFITMWSLGMAASFFLGLSVFLWVRLSTTKKRASLRRQGWRDRKGQGPAAKENESLWAEPGSSTEERVEFWYANGATVEEDKRRQRARQGMTRKNGERQVGTEDDLWIQPKVTLKDITEFWHANGRVRHTEETQRMRERDRESESEEERHRE